MLANLVGSASDKNRTGGEQIMSGNGNGDDTPKCAECAMRKKADLKPNSLIGRFWRWHTKWCPGWKAYQAWLAEREA